jgi:hypothetical protein
MEPRISLTKRTVLANGIVQAIIMLEEASERDGKVANIDTCWERDYGR